MSLLIREFPWHSTPLGDLASWSRGLFSIVNLALASPLPTAIHFGPEMLLLYNDAYRALLAEKHPSALGQPASLVWAEVWPHIRSEYEAVLSEGKVFLDRLVSLPVGKGCGERRFLVNYALSPIFESNKISGSYCTARNVTEDVAVAQALIETDERLRAALSARDSIGTWDWHIQDDLVFAERKFAEVYGANYKEAASGVPLATFVEQIHPEDKPAVLKGITETVEFGKPYDEEYRLLQADGSTRWVQARGRCFYEQSGIPSRFIGVATDITSWKQPERSQKSPSSHAYRSAARLANAMGNPPPAAHDREKIVGLLYALLDNKSEFKGASQVKAEDRAVMAAGLLEAIEESLTLSHSYSDAKPFDTINLANAAASVQDRAKQVRGLHLVSDSSPTEDGSRYMSQILYALWSVLGQTLRNLPIDTAGVFSEQ